MKILFKKLCESAHTPTYGSAYSAGADLYSALRERGILVRHFTAEKIAEYNRITVGTREQVDALIDAIKDILS